MKAISVNDLAPYPSTIGDVTAEGMAKYLTVSAMRAYRQAQDGSGTSWPSATRRDAQARYIDEWSLAFVLRELQERAGARAADTVARVLWYAWEEGGSYGETLQDWLGEYDVNPDHVTADMPWYPAPEVA